MEGMGRSRRGHSLGLVTAGMAILAIAVVTIVMATDTSAEPEDMPDLMVEEVYNITEVYQGEDSFFNVTLRNNGEAAYTPRDSPELEVFGYIDNSTWVSGHTTVYREIYRRSSETVNLKVNFGTVGNHTLRVVVDPSNNINESKESNNEMTINVTVLEATENRPPDADGGNDRVGYLDEPVFFSARYSEDPDDDPLTYSWIFGDGGEGSGRFTNHTYSYEGQYGASLIVSDGEKIDIDSFTVTIIKPPVNHPPVAAISIATAQVDRGKDLTLDGRSSTDPDLDKLTYDWDFDASDGLDDWVRGALVSHSWSTAGLYQVTLRVSDGKLSNTTNTMITVLEPLPPNQAPRAFAGEDANAVKGKEVELWGEGFDDDGHIVSWEWDVDADGTYDTYSETDGHLVTTFDETGLKTLWLRVTDNRGDVSRDSVTITVEKQKEGGDSPGPGAIVAITVIAALATSILLARQPSKGGPGGRPKIEKNEPTIK